VFIDSCKQKWSHVTACAVNGGYVIWSKRSTHQAYGFKVATLGTAEDATELCYRSNDLPSAYPRSFNSCSAKKQPWCCYKPDLNCN